MPTPYRSFSRRRLLNRGIFAAVVIASFMSFLGPDRAFAVTEDTRAVGLQAEIPANPPTVPATITVPSNGQRFTALPINVSGLCSGEVLVKLFKNGVFAGSAQCNNGTYTITIDLFNSQNDLIARVYDALDQTGPDSATITVYFDQGGFNSSGPRISLTSAFAKRGANPKQTINWPINLSGGTGPYAISVDWGDGNTQLISRSNPGEFNLSHQYSSPSTNTIIIKATDANGASAFLQVVGVANGALAQDNQGDSSSTQSAKVVIMWWPVAVAFVLVIVSFWLGGSYRVEGLRRQAEKRIQY